MEDINKVQLAHQLLGVLNTSQHKEVTMFTKTYRNLFAVSLVPPIKQFGTDLVLINREQAINYLKMKYQFFNREERNSLLAEVASEFHPRKGIEDV